jgi:hypothetical protein
MGRSSYGTPEHAETKIKVFKVNVCPQGYDDGGAYWGTGKALYCATDDGDYRLFTRTDSRLTAIVEFGIEYKLLAKPPKKEYLTLRGLEYRGVLGASGIKLRQALQDLGFEG